MGKLDGLGYPSRIFNLAGTGLKRIKALLFGTVFIAPASNAALVDYFKFEDGSTNWQYIANFSSSVLIVLLSIALITLFFSHRRALRYNRKLEEIRALLEERVAERTQTLKESNTLLQKTNRLLEMEVSDHKSTEGRLRTSESYLRNILESMPVLLIGLNEDLEVTQWNKLTELRTGISEKAALGKNLWDAFPTVTLSSEQVMQVLESDRPNTIKYSQRGQYYFDITLFPLQGVEETGVVILIDDVTQQTLTENMLIQRDKMSSMGELASTMAHDIEVPLRRVLERLESLADRKESVDLEEFVGIAKEKGAQVSAIIDNLLGFAGDQSRERQIVRVPDVVNDSIELANDLLSFPSGRRFREIKIEKAYEASLPAIPGYISELKQVFLSLFRHAGYAFEELNEERVPIISIEISEHYDAVWAKIQHNGRGLTEAEQQDIFEPFFMNPQETDDEDTAWRRLSFSYFIVTEHHKGQMAVTSDMELGTTFHIQLQL